MKAGIARIALLLFAILAVAAQYILVQRSHAAAQQIILRLVPYGELRYDKLWPWFWGAGTVWGLSFQPAGLMQLNLRTPIGYRVQARELRIRRLDPGWIDGIPSVRGTLGGLRLPVPERRSARGALPSLHELGYSVLELDVAFRARFIAEAKLLLLDVDAVGAGIGRLRLSMQLEGDPRVLQRAPDSIVLRGMDLEFIDDGLLSRYRHTAAAQRGISETALTKALQRALDRAAQSPQWTWDAASTRALRRGLGGARSLHAHLDPPGEILLRNIRLYRPRDWGKVLGFSLSVATAAQ